MSMRNRCRRPESILMASTISILFSDFCMSPLANLLPSLLSLLVRFQQILLALNDFATLYQRLSPPQTLFSEMLANYKQQAQLCLAEHLIQQQSFDKAAHFWEQSKGEAEPAALRALDILRRSQPKSSRLCQKLGISFSQRLRAFEQLAHRRQYISLFTKLFDFAKERVTVQLSVLHSAYQMLLKEGKVELSQFYTASPLRINSIKCGNYSVRLKLRSISESKKAERLQQMSSRLQRLYSPLQLLKEGQESKMQLQRGLLQRNRIIEESIKSYYKKNRETKKKLAKLFQLKKHCYKQHTPNSLLRPHNRYSVTDRPRHQQNTFYRTLKQSLLLFQEPEEEVVVLHGTMSRQQRLREDRKVLFSTHGHFYQKMR